MPKTTLRAVPECAVPFPSCCYTYSDYLLKVIDSRHVLYRRSSARSVWNVRDGGSASHLINDVTEDTLARVALPAKQIRSNPPLLSTKSKAFSFPPLVLFQKETFEKS